MNYYLLFGEIMGDTFFYRSMNATIIVTDYQQTETDFFLIQFYL